MWHDSGASRDIIQSLPSEYHGTKGQSRAADPRRIGNKTSRGAGGSQQSEALCEATSASLVGAVLPHKRQLILLSTFT